MFRETLTKEETHGESQNEEKQEGAVPDAIEDSVDLPKEHEVKKSKALALRALRFATNGPVSAREGPWIKQVFRATGPAGKE